MRRATHRQFCLSIGLLVSALLMQAGPLLAQSAETEPALELGDEWTEYRKEVPKGPYGDDSVFHCGGWWYLPNRVLDVFDIVRVDAGVGLSTGAVARVTRWGQVGYRDVDPWSFRLGLFGRDWPFLIERSVEKGVGPWFNQSRERDVADFEVGAGLDLFVAGGYLGLNFGGALDFVAGFFCLDPSGDDRAD